jgi:hypothetical protein
MPPWQAVLLDQPSKQNSERLSELNRGGKFALDYRLPDAHGQAAIFWVNKTKPFLIIQSFRAAGEES